MLMVLFSLVIAAVCAVIDIPSLKGGRKRRERIVWILFWVAGIAATVCTFIQLNIPSPLLLVIMIYRPFNDLVSSWYQ